MTIGQTLTKYAIKTAGTIGAGILLYDAHKEGQRISGITAKKANGDASLYWFDNTRNLNSPSVTNMKLKDALFNWEITSNIREFVNSGIGYVKGFAQMAVSDVVPWALSVAALVTKGPSATNKGTGAKIAGGALGLYSLYAFAKNVCGIGVNNK